MPKYCYYCESCKEAYEVVHSMKERLKKCDLCNEHTLRIIPSIPAYLSKKKSEKEKKVGSVVEEYIEKNKESIKEEKKKLKNKEYKNE
jgi:putative FmdB family regulatory protein